MRVNALFFTGFGISSVLGVVFNNTVVPFMGWDAMFILLGCFTAVSFIMLLFFRPVRGKLIPFDDEGDIQFNVSGGIDYFDGPSAKEHAINESKERRQRRKRRSEEQADRED